MNRVLVVFSDGLLGELDSARGLVSRSAWIRQAVEDKLMKEAVAPLVPDGLAGPTHWSKGRLTDEDWASFQGGAGFETPEPKPKARRKKGTVEAKRKPKTCQHSNTVRKLGMLFCEDCGEFVYQINP